MLSSSRKTAVTSMQPVFNTDGHLKKDAKIVIVGGGVSGITAASQLQDLGYENVQILEAAAQLGGKCQTIEHDGAFHDMGALAGVRLDYHRIRAMSNRLQFEVRPFPRRTVYNSQGEVSRGLSVCQKITVLFQSIRYIVSHWLCWRGTNTHRVRNLPPSLQQTTQQFMQNQGYQTLGLQLLSPFSGFGYGFYPEVPAYMFTEYLRPSTLIGSGLVGDIYSWRQGTQSLWQTIATEKNLNFRTHAQVLNIERGRTTGRHPIALTVLNNADHSSSVLECDQLLLTFNPRDAVQLLAAPTPEELRLSQSIRTYDYRTVLCQVSDLKVGQRACGYIRPNMTRDRVGHPLGYFKKEAAQDMFVFYHYGDDALPYEQRETDILTKLQTWITGAGGQLQRVHHVSAWDFAPHPSMEALQGGWFENFEAIQGNLGTHYAGEVFSFGIMPRAADNAAARARMMTRQPARLRGADLRVTVVEHKS